MEWYIKQEEIGYVIQNQGDSECTKINNRHKEKQIKMVWTLEIMKKGRLP